MDVFRKGTRVGGSGHPAQLTSEAGALDLAVLTISTPGPSLVAFDVLQSTNVSAFLHKSTRRAVVDYLVLAFSASVCG